jgi:ubiquinone/menaquinone biosynthesis C-methylase UbiE
MVSEIARVLKPGGLYLGINFSTGHPQLQFGRPLGGGDHGDFSAGVFRGIGFRHFFDEAEIRALFQQFEFRELRLVRSTNLLDPSDGSEEIVVVAARQY